MGDEIAVVSEWVGRRQPYCGNSFGGVNVEDALFRWERAMDQHRRCIWPQVLWFVGPLPYVHLKVQPRSHDVFIQVQDIE